MPQPVTLGNQAWDERKPEPVSFKSAVGSVLGKYKFSWRDIPIVQWLPQYNRHKAFSDVLAGLTVGVMLIPQGMAYSTLAGLPPIYGLYSSTIPLFIYALLASSTKVAVGPVGPTAILINAAVTAMDPVDANDYLNKAIALAFVTGIIQIAMGMLRFGFIANFLSWPVMSGFTSAAAFIITASQLKDFVGYKGEKGEAFYERVYYAFANIETWHWQTVIVSSACLIVLYAAKLCTFRGKSLPRWFPAQLLVVVIVLVISSLADLKSYGVEVVGNIPAGMPSPAVPSMSLTEFRDMLSPAFVLAIISYVGSISLAMIFAREVKEVVNTNAELVALGTACLGGSFFTGHVISGSFTRSALNSSTGAKSPLANAVCGGLIVIVLLFIAPLFELLPKAVLAALILSTVKNLITVGDAKQLWGSSKMDFFQMAVTFIAVLGIGIATGLLLSMGVSILLLVYRSFQPRIRELGRLPLTELFVDIQRYPAARVISGIIVVRIDGELHFGNIGHVSTVFRDLLRVGDLKAVLSQKDVPDSEDEIDNGEDSMAVIRTETHHYIHSFSIHSGRSGWQKGYQGSLGGMTGATGVTGLSARSGYGSDNESAEEGAGVHELPVVAEGGARQEGGTAAEEVVVDTSQAEGAEGGAATALKSAESVASHCEDLRAVILDGSRITSVDASACRELRDTIKTYRRAGIPFMFAAFPGPARDALERFGLYADVGPNAFLTVMAAVSSVAAEYSTSDTDDESSRGDMTSSSSSSSSDEHDHDYDTEDTATPATGGGPGSTVRSRAGSRQGRRRRNRRRSAKHTKAEVRFSRNGGAGNRRASTGSERVDSPGFVSTMQASPAMQQSLTISPASTPNDQLLQGGSGAHDSPITPRVATVEPAQLERADSAGAGENPSLRMLRDMLPASAPGTSSMPLIGVEMMYTTENGGVHGIRTATSAGSTMVTSTSTPVSKQGSLNADPARDGNVSGDKKKL